MQISLIKLTKTWLQRCTAQWQPCRLLTQYSMKHKGRSASSFNVYLNIHKVSASSHQPQSSLADAGKILLLHDKCRRGSHGCGLCSSPKPRRYCEQLLVLIACLSKTCAAPLNLPEQTGQHCVAACTGCVYYCTAATLVKIGSCCLS